MKSFIERGEYKIAIDQTYLVGLELDAVPTVVEQLARRSWAFALAPASSTFTPCDDPVVLSWADGKDRGPYSPGFGVAARSLCSHLAGDCFDRAVRKAAVVWHLNVECAGFCWHLN